MCLVLACSPAAATFFGAQGNSHSEASLHEAVEILSQIDFFQDLSEDALLSVAGAFVVWAYDAGQGMQRLNAALAPIAAPQRFRRVRVKKNGVLFQRGVGVFHTLVPSAVSAAA